MEMTWIWESTLRNADLRQKNEFKGGGVNLDIAAEGSTTAFTNLAAGTSAPSWEQHSSSMQKSKFANRKPFDLSSVAHCARLELWHLPTTPWRSKSLWRLSTSPRERQLYRKVGSQSPRYVTGQDPPATRIGLPATSQP